MRRLLLLLALVCQGCVLHAQQGDEQALRRALDYFRGGKYHESMILLEHLDSVYTINPRYRAYLALCYYREQLYTGAVEILDSVMPAVRAFAPQEQAVYAWAGGESHFELHQYGQAEPYYEVVAACGNDTDKGDAFFRLGFCSYFLGRKADAADYFLSAYSYYRRFSPGERQARMAQAKKMAVALHPSESMKETVETAPSSLPSSGDEKAEAWKERTTLKDGRKGK